MFRNDGGNTFNDLNVRLTNAASSNTQAIGARIFVTANGVTQIRELKAGSNYVSQDPVEQHFGLNDISQIDTLRVEWPDGVTTIMNNVASNQHLVIAHP